MLKTVMFDLDGTLLPVTQQEFLSVYLGELRKVFSRIGLDAELAMRALWAGTEAMVRNDGAKSNAERFWNTFGDIMNVSDERLRAAEAACDAFYTNEFNVVKSIMRAGDRALPRRLIDLCKAKGFDVVLATNPLFPPCAVTTRLEWIGLLPEDFRLITNYQNSRFCKPNTEYYRDLMERLGVGADECIMIGNNTNEDMIAGTLGIATYLVTDCIENEAGADISRFTHGTLAQLEGYLNTLGDFR